MDELKRLLADIPDVPDSNVVAVEVWTSEGEVGASIPLGALRRLVAIEAAAVRWASARASDVDAGDLLREVVDRG